MFDTERYEITFTSIKNINFNLERVVHSWTEAANKFYYEAGIFIGAKLVEKMLVCRDSSPLERAIVAISTRNPLIEPSREKYHKVLNQVILEVKGDLDNPHTTVSEDDITISIISREMW